MLTLFALAIGTQAARADRALVVGINRYPGYADMDLSGPVNDATAMRTVLKKQGFVVTMLTDRQATRQGVLQALQNLRVQMQPHERLVFYFLVMAPAMRAIGPACCHTMPSLKSAKIKSAND